MILALVKAGWHILINSFWKFIVVSCRYRRHYCCLRSSPTVKFFSWAMMVISQNPTEAKIDNFFQHCHLRPSNFKASRVCQPWKKQSEVLMVQFLCEVSVPLYFFLLHPLIPTCLSGSIRSCSYAQMCCQGNFIPSACQSKWSYPIWVSLAHCRLLAVVNACTTCLHTRRHYPYQIHNVFCTLLSVIISTLFAPTDCSHWQLLLLLIFFFWGGGSSRD